MTASVARPDRACGSTPLSRSSTSKYIEFRSQILSFLAAWSPSGIIVYQIVDIVVPKFLESTREIFFLHPLCMALLQFLLLVSRSDALGADTDFRGDNKTEQS